MERSDSEEPRVVLGLRVASPFVRAIMKMDFQIAPVTLFISVLLRKSLRRRGNNLGYAFVVREANIICKSYSATRG